VDVAERVGGVPHGPNWERNNERRAKNKARKAKRNGSQAPGLGSVGEVPEWRRKAMGQGVVRQGYFSTLETSVQQELKRTRAELLIQRNKVSLARAKAQSKSMDPESPEYIVREMIRITSLAVNLKKKTHDQQIGGWAETVADGLTKQVAASAPSSVPSLESVGLGKSALKSSDGSDSVESARRVEYERRKDDLCAQFERQAVIMPEEEEVAFKILDDEFADVVYPPGEAAKIKERRGVESFILCNFEPEEQSRLFTKMNAFYDYEEPSFYH